jgi:hypothetical protein
MEKLRTPVAQPHPSPSHPPFSKQDFSRSIAADARDGKDKCCEKTTLYCRAVFRVSRERRADGLVRFLAPNPRDILKGERNT